MDITKQVTPEEQQAAQNKLRICQLCHKPFFPTNGSSGTYCSKACSNAARTEESLLSQLTNIFIKDPSKEKISLLIKAVPVKEVDKNE